MNSPGSFSPHKRISARLSQTRTRATTAWRLPSAHSFPAMAHGSARRVSRIGSSTPRRKRRRAPTSDAKLSGEAVKDAAGAFEFGETLLFGAKLAGMRNHAAAGAASGMLDVQHLMIKDVLDSALRNADTIHAAVEKDLIRPRIVTAKLTAPASRTPSNVRTLQ